MRVMQKMASIKALRGGGSGGSVATEEVTVTLNFPAGSEETDILAETTYSGFAMSSSWGVYAVDTEVPYTLTVGETYTVVWDGEIYECVCQDASALISNGVALGNAASWGLSGNGEPFAIATTNRGTATTGSITDTEAGGSHTVRIYQVTEGNSDMVVEPSNGKVLSQVTITKPADLLPENIRAGKNIGGVAGALDKYIDYTLNEDGEIVAAAMYGFTEIPAGCFAYSSALTSVDLSGSPGIISIGDYAFRGCSCLVEFDIPDSVTSIGDYAFYRCTALTSIDIPDGVTSIGNYVFDCCSSLTSIDIPDGVTSIGTRAFGQCSSLTSIDIPDSVTSIGFAALDSCTALTSFDIPGGITSIGFLSGCSSLTSIDIPDSITSLGDSAFSRCSSLTSITIPDSVTSIGGSAFSGCTALTSVVIGSGVTSIGTYAFNSANALTSATFKDTTTWYVGTSAGATTTAVTVTNASTAATCLRSTYLARYWTKV